MNTLTQKDLEMIERMVMKSQDDILSQMGRNIEQLHEQIDRAEIRIDSRLADIEEAIKEKN